MTDFQVPDSEDLAELKKAFSQIASMLAFDHLTGIKRIPVMEVVRLPCSPNRTVTLTIRELRLIRLALEYACGELVIIPVETVK